MRGEAMPKSIVLLVLFSFFVTACGPKSLPPIVENGVVNEEQKRQQEMVVKSFTERHDMVNRVAYRVLTRNVGVCSDTMFESGALIMDAGDVFYVYREAAKYFLGMSSRPSIFAIAPESPADKAGLKTRDVLLSVNGDSVGGSGAALRKLRKNRVVTLEVERAGQKLSLEMTQDRACESPVVLFEDPVINAHALGNAIFMGVGLVKLVKNDDELAMVIGHELAHNAMSHLDAKRNNSAIGAILIDLPIGLLTGINPGIGSGIGGGMFSQDFETEADYIGLYFTAKAGYDINGVAEMWRRFAVEHPEAIYMATTHPTTANRFVVLEAARDEIKAKLAAGKPLEPNMQPGK